MALPKQTPNGKARWQGTGKENSGKCFSQLFKDIYIEYPNRCTHIAIINPKWNQIEVIGLALFHFL